MPSQETRNKSKALRFLAIVQRYVLYHAFRKYLAAIGRKVCAHAQPFTGRAVYLYRAPIAAVHEGPKAHVGPAVYIVWCMHTPQYGRSGCFLSLGALYIHTYVAGL